jgi:Poly(3-hydroxybutyrate) depolymerase
MPDTHVPYYGGYGTGYAGVYMPPIDSVIGVWASNDTCTGTLDTIYHVGGAVGKKWMNCSSCSEVLIYTTTDGGHSWPGGNQTANGDPVSTQLNATDLIWNFFSQHSLNCSNTSISESSLLENIKIYLNSAKNQIIIDIPEYISDFTVEILDLEGRFLLAKKNEKIISTNTLVNKTYILIFTSNRINFIKKLNKVD